MSAYDLQRMAVFFAVILAAADILRRVWTAFRSPAAGACGGCTTCPGSHPGTPALKELPLVQLSLPGVDATQNRGLD